MSLGAGALPRVPDRWIVLAGLMVGRIAFGFAFQAMATVAPGVADGLNLDALAIGTLIGLFMLPGLVLAFPGGMLAQWIGESRMLGIGLAGMALGSLICGLADDYAMLWVGRLLCGIAAILVTVVMSKVVIDWFVGKELTTAMGLFLAGYPAGIGLALVALGPFATPAGWPTAFFLTSALCGVGLVVFLVTHRPSPVATSLDAGRVRLTKREIGMISLSASTASLYNGAYLIMLSFVPLYLVSEGLTPVAAAAAVGAGVWVSILAVPLGGLVTDYLRRPNLIMIVGAGVWGIGALFIIPLSHTPGCLTVLFAMTALVGAFPIGAMIALASEAMRAEVRGPGMGLFYSWFYGAAAAAPAVAGFVVDQTGETSSAIYLISICSLASIGGLWLFRLAQAREMPRLTAR